MSDENKQSEPQKPSKTVFLNPLPLDNISIELRNEVEKETGVKFPEPKPPKP